MLYCFVRNILAAFVCLSVALSKLTFTYQPFLFFFPFPSLSSSCPFSSSFSSSSQTIVQFSRLAKIEVGGTKGKSLTDNVMEVSAEFEAAVATFAAVDVRDKETCYY